MRNSAFDCVNETCARYDVERLGWNPQFGRQEKGIYKDTSRSLRCLVCTHYTSLGTK